MKRIFIILFFLFLIFESGNSYGQELNCNVSLNTSQLQGTNKEVFNTLRTAIAEFMNNTVWTNTLIDVSERIECNILINIIEQPTAVSYKGTIQVQARRPVYGSGYNTVLFNYVDNDFQFKYSEFDALEFSENAHLSNLSSMLAFYAYVIIGLDFDSFSQKGGDLYFQKADKIVNNASNSSDVGWKAFDDKGRKNRYWLVNNLSDTEYEPIRLFYYNYHRLGLDVMGQSLEKGRLVIRDAVLELEKLYDSKPDPFMYLFQITLDSKADEIVQVFSQAPPEDKKRIFNIMVKVDPASPTKYATLKP